MKWAIDDNLKWSQTYAMSLSLEAFFVPLALIVCFYGHNDRAPNVKSIVGNKENFLKTVVIITLVYT